MHSSTRSLTPGASSLGRLLKVAGLLALLSAGVQLIPGRAAPVSLTQAILLAIAAVVAVIPAATRTLGSVFERTRRLSDSTRGWLTLAVWALASAYLIFTAFLHHRYLQPQWDDENSYLIQTHMLAHGMLWERAHPLADFFESFHLLTRPVYCSIYFPGSALLYAPGVWLGLPIWMIPVAAAGWVVALTYQLTAEFLDDLWGLLAAMLVLADPMFREFSTRVLSQVPAALMGLLMIWAWLRWRRAVARTGQALAWAGLLGAFVGWAALIRPFDAIAFAAPGALAVAIDLRRLHWPARRRTVTMIAMGVAPFLALQLIFNVGVTGRWWQTPYAYEQQQELPGMLPGLWAFNPHARPASKLRQKQLAYDSFVAEMRQHQLDHLPIQAWEEIMADTQRALPCAALALLLPIALIGVTRRRRWVMASVLPLFVLLYCLYPIFLTHYLFSMVSVTAFVVVLGASALVEVSDGPGWRRFAGVFFPLAIAACALGAMPEVNPAVSWQITTVRSAAAVHDALAANVRAPAIVLFLFPPKFTPRQEITEPVYNSGVAWPDDAPIIRAQDLGSRDVELFNYYAARDPSRRVYRFNRADNSVRYLGRVGSLAAGRIKSRAAK